MTAVLGAAGVDLVTIEDAVGHGALTSTERYLSKESGVAICDSRRSLCDYAFASVR